MKKPIEFVGKIIKIQLFLNISELKYQFQLKQAIQIRLIIF